jgi:hypothetical protein
LRTDRFRVRSKGLIFYKLLKTTEERILSDESSPSAQEKHTYPKGYIRLHKLVT